MSIAGNENNLDIVWPNAQPVSHPPPPKAATHWLVPTRTCGQGDNGIGVFE